MPTSTLPNQFCLFKKKKEKKAKTNYLISTERKKEINLEEKLLYLTDRIDRLDLNHLRPSKMITDFDRQSTPFAWIDMQEGKGKHEDFVMLDTGMHGIYDLSNTVINE